MKGRLSFLMLALFSIVLLTSPVSRAEAAVGHTITPLILSQGPDVSPSHYSYQTGVFWAIIGVAAITVGLLVDEPIIAVAGVVVGAWGIITMSQARRGAFIVPQRNGVIVGYFWRF